MTVTMIKRRRDDLTLHLTGLVHARALFEAPALGACLDGVGDAREQWPGAHAWLTFRVTRAARSSRSIVAGSPRQ
jgi:hypothetical protein